MGRAKIHYSMETVTTIARLIVDALTFGWLLVRRDRALAAENLFLRKQLAFYQERGTRPRRLDAPTRAVLVVLSRLFDWRDALVVVQPATLVRWHRQGFRLIWRWKSRPGRPRIPAELRRLIRTMALDNPSWGEERIANELLLKLGIQVSPRTVRKYMPKRPPGRPRGDQRWATFLRNNAQAIVACDFCVVATATFRLLYILVVMEHGTRKILHCNVTVHPTAEWTLHQLREAFPSDHEYRFLIHDRDSIFSQALDKSIRNLRVRALKTPYRAPQANAICERLIGTLRREFLDWIIPINENHLRRFLRSWIGHYNGGRPHMSLGPGVPDPPDGIPAQLQSAPHSFTSGFQAVARPILGGLHHEYGLVQQAA
jgi:putative transposase